MRPKGEHPADGWAGTYGRLSMLPTHYEAHSPETHERLAREGALTRGLKIKPGYEFYDMAKSGSHPRVQRPDFERAMKALLGQEIEALIVPALDRLSRQGMRHLGEILDAIEEVRGRIIFAREGLDSSQPGARNIIAFLAEQARSEAKTMASRQVERHETARLAGRFVWKRPFGMMIVDGKLQPHPVEAPIVRRIVNAFIVEHQSPRAIARELNTEGVKTPSAFRAEELQAQGKPTRGRVDGSWGFTTIRSILVNPALAGWMEHNGKIVIDESGDPVSFGDGVITPVERIRILAEFSQRSTLVKRAKTTDRIGGKTGAGRPARYLLTGYATCASCRYKASGWPKWGKAGSCYRCNSKVHGYECPARGFVSEAPADAEVKRQLTTRLAAMEPGDPILDAIAERWLQTMLPDQEGERGALEAKLAAVRSRLADLDEARYGRGEFETAEDIARWEQLRARNLAQRAAVQEALEKLGPRPVFDVGVLLDSHLSQEAWEAASLPERRAILAITVDKVLIKSPKEARSIDERVRVVLVGEES
jgi:site-specific DNA recombinase